MIELHDLRKNFGELKAVDGINLNIPSGQFYVALGPNAAGKTTDFEEARDMQRILRENGFPGAFVIAFRDKERIVIAEALKSNPK